MNTLPKGLDYQGRHPEAAHAATGEGEDYEDTPEDIRFRALFWRGYWAVIAAGAVGAIFWPY